MSLPAILLFCMYLFWFFFLAGIAPGGAVDRPVWKLASYMEEPFRTTSEAGTSQSRKGRRRRQQAASAVRNRIPWETANENGPRGPPRPASSELPDTETRHSSGIYARFVTLNGRQNNAPVRARPFFFSFLPRNATRCPLNPLSHFSHSRAVTAVATPKSHTHAHRTPRTNAAVGSPKNKHPPNRENASSGNARFLPSSLFY